MLYIHVFTQYYTETKQWKDTEDDIRKMHVLRLLNVSDVSDHERRMKAARAILYLAQGMSRY